VPDRRVNKVVASSCTGPSPSSAWGRGPRRGSGSAPADVRVDGRVVTDPLTWVDLDPNGHATRTTTNCSHSVDTGAAQPRGVVTTHRDERGRRTVYDLLPADLPWAFPWPARRRLRGLLILTNDSALSRA